MARVLVRFETVVFPNLHFTLFSLIIFIEVSCEGLSDTVSLSSNVIEIQQKTGTFRLFFRAAATAYLRCRTPMESLREVKSALAVG